MANPNHEKSTKRTAKTPKPLSAGATATKPAVKFERKAEEAKLSAKYPDQKIVAGSLRDSGEIAEFGQKRSIEIRCQATDKKFRIATSDLHQVRYHPDHMRQVRLDRRKELRAKKKKVRKTTAPKSEATKATTQKTRATRKPSSPRTRAPKVEAQEAPVAVVEVPVAVVESVPVAEPVTV